MHKRRNLSHDTEKGCPRTPTSGWVNETDQQKSGKQEPDPKGPAEKEIVHDPQPRVLDLSVDLGSQPPGLEPRKRYCPFHANRPKGEKKSKTTKQQEERREVPGQQSRGEKGLSAVGSEQAKISYAPRERVLGQKVGEERGMGGARGDWVGFGR